METLKLNLDCLDVDEVLIKTPYTEENATIVDMTFVFKQPLGEVKQRFYEENKEALSLIKDYFSGKFFCYKYKLAFFKGLDDVCCLKHVYFFDEEKYHFESKYENIRRIPTDFRVFDKDLKDAFTLIFDVWVEIAQKLFDYIKLTLDKLDKIGQNIYINLDFKNRL